MAVYRRSRRNRFFLVLLALTSVTVLTLDYRGGGDGALESVRQTARDAFAPVQSAADTVFSPVTGFFSSIGDFGDLRKENAQLRRELEAEGIRCEVVGDYLNAGLGDIPGLKAELWVHQEDVERARGVLQRGQEGGGASADEDEGE